MTPKEGPAKTDQDSRSFLRVVDLSNTGDAEKFQSRQKRLRELRDAVRNGTYHVPTELLAEKLLACHTYVFRPV